MSTATMGRPKAKVPDPNRKPVAVTIKGSEEWKGWLEEAAAHARLSVSSFVDVAVTERAKRDGFPRRPPER